MFWFLLIFPLIIFPWGGLELYSTGPKLLSLYIFVLSTWIILSYRRKFWVENINKGFSFAEVLVFGFVILIGISTAFSVNKMTSIFGTPTRFEGILSLISYCSIFIFSFRLMNFYQMKKIIPGLVAVSLLLSIHGLFQHYSLDFLPNKDVEGSLVRSDSIFGNPNFYGSYIVLVMMLSLSLFIIEKGRKTKVFLYVSICLAFTAMLFSGTRSAWIGFFVGMVFLTTFVVIKRKQLWKRWGLLLLSLFSILLLINATEGGNYFNRLFSIINDSKVVLKDKEEQTGREGSNRIFIWKKSLPLIKQYYLIGSGPDTFKDVFPNNTKEAKEFLHGQKADKAHNEYIQIAVTLGIPALLTYLLLVCVVLWNAIKATKAAQGNDRILLYGLMATILGYLAQAFFNISVITVAPLFWAILGITYGISHHKLKIYNKLDSKGHFLKQNGINQIA